MFNEKDFHYIYTRNGYMIYYKDKPIGGAGIAVSAKGRFDNLKIFRKAAEYDLYNILRGRGLKRYLDIIDKIDKEQQTII